jgi:hypothetical protein
MAALLLCATETELRLRFFFKSFFGAPNRAPFLSLFNSMAPIFWGTEWLEARLKRLIC